MSVPTGVLTDVASAPVGRARPRPIGSHRLTATGGAVRRPVVAVTDPPDLSPVDIDLSSVIRSAIAAELARRPQAAIAFLVQPQLTATTRQPEALRELLRVLVAGVVSVVVTSPRSVLLFDASPPDLPTFYALRVLCAGDAPVQNLGEQAGEIARASEARVWDVPPGDGEAVVVCFALERPDLVAA
jgi:hypothetical protein